MWTFLFDPRRFATSGVHAKNNSNSFENFDNFSIKRSPRPQKCCSVHYLIFYYGSKHGSGWLSRIFCFCGANFSPIKTAIYAEKHPRYAIPKSYFLMLEYDNIQRCDCQVEILHFHNFLMGVYDTEQAGVLRECFLVAFSV